MTMLRWISFWVLLAPAVWSERVYDTLVFTPEKCQELGMEKHFDSCAVLEFCTTPSSRRQTMDEGDGMEEGMEEGMEYYDPQEEEYYMDTVEGGTPPDQETEMIAPGVRSKDETDELFAEEVESDMEEGMAYYDPQEEEEEEYFMDTMEGEGPPDKETEMIVPGIRSKDEADELFAEEVEIAEIEETMKDSKYEYQQQQQQQPEPQEGGKQSATTASTPVNTAKFGYRLEGSSHCSWPGPIMRLRRGEKHGLFLKGNNDVATNLHFHGLHTSSKGAGDWLYRSVQGEENLLVYELDLKNKPHMGGTHWYHSHLHGASWDQVKGGAFGMIVVEDNGHEVGTNDPNVLAFLNEKEHEKTLVFDDSQNNQHFYANGLAEETLELVKDSWYRLRMLMVGIGSYRSEIKVEFDLEDDCEIHTLANDGIFRSQVPNSVRQTDFVLSPSSRVDVAIRCSATANILVDGDKVAKIVTTDTSTPLAVTPFVEDGGSWPSARLDYTQPLLDLSASEVSTMTIRVDETSINGVNEARHTPLCNDDGKDFAYGSVQEWKLEGTATHPFHVHMYPMQVASHGCAPHHEVGEYYDTIIAPDASLRNPCIVRVSLVDIDGPTTVHCHLFEHAEHGALTWFNVVKEEVEEDDDTTNDVPTCIGICNEPEQPPPKCSE